MVNLHDQPYDQSALLDRLIEQQGNATAAAATLGVSASALWRWRNNERPLRGPVLVAVLAVLAHPRDYKSFRKLARPAHRPAGKGPK